MKILSKLNRGLLLTIVVILGVAAYLIGLHFSQKADREIIRTVCAEYIQTETQYRMLPEGKRQATPNISEAELNAYVEKAKADIKSLYVDNEICYRYLLEEIEENLKKQSKGTEVITDYQKEVRNVSNFSFDGDTVSVLVTCYTSYNGPDIYGGGESAVEKDSITREEMTLQKVDGTWKVTYAYLQPYDPNY